MTTYYCAPKHGIDLPPAVGLAARFSLATALVASQSLKSETQGHPPARNNRSAIICGMIRPKSIWIACLMIVCAGSVFGAVKQVAIRSGVVLKPGETYTAQVESQKPVEIGWTAVQPKRCTMDCIQMTHISGTSRLPPFAAAMNARGNYTPTDGRVVVEYKNVSQETVTIDVFRIERTCDAEACKLFDPNQKGRPMVFKVAEFKSITTSADGSYSTISGVVESGRAFHIHVVWWTDQKGGFQGCPRWIKGYVDNHTPKEKYSPYVLSGMALGDGNDIVLKSIDTCVPLAPHYGALEKSVFK